MGSCRQFTSKLSVILRTLFLKVLPADYAHRSGLRPEGQNF
jgi:hypothetical protein